MEKYISMIFYDIPELFNKDKKRLWSKIDKGSGNNCWNWLGRTNSDGYGEFDIKEFRYLVHRIIYSLYNPFENIDNKLILHECGNPSCVNPCHLFSGISQDNVINFVNKSRHSSIILKGSKRPNLKLNEKEIIEIREKYTKGYNQYNLAKEYCVNQSTISKVINYNY